MNCIICGCSHFEPCEHPDAGPCGWHSTAYAVCTYCADPEFLSLDRSETIKQSTRLTPYILRNLFKSLDIDIKVSKDPKWHGHKNGEWTINTKGQISRKKLKLFESWIENFFLDRQRNSPGSYTLHPGKNIMNKEL